MGTLGNIDFLKTRGSLMPVMFIGHGSPMNAIANNGFTKSLSGVMGLLNEKPDAIMIISAHWLTKGTLVTTTDKPSTIYDFGGFPEELYRIQYPAPGAPEIANETSKAITLSVVGKDPLRGLDHGAWTILRHIVPSADIPVFQLSIDFAKQPEYHYNLAKELYVLRKKGVLIIASGNIVHNLYQIDFDDNAKPYDWALEFDAKIEKLLSERNDKALIDYMFLGNAARLSVPTNDHYLPMLYTLGSTKSNESLQNIYTGIQNASISMRSFIIC
jgi:4,5-DOPA dioxygenase extradiol